MSSLPTIAGIEITTDEQGRFNLNLLHKASGLGPHKAPNKWLSIEPTTELIGELNSQTHSEEFGPINSIRGGNSPGTFAHKLLAISYAGWISPAFQLKVNQVFLDYQSANKPAIPQSFPEALRLAATAMEERDRAIATKAEIGSRREATAMSTASAAVRKANKLQVELDKSQEYCTVKRMQMNHHGQKFNWRLLKRNSEAMGIPAIDVYDANYGTVKAYHLDVWQKAYAVSIEVELAA